MGMGPLPWVMNAELFSKEAKATSSSLCASFNWLCSFLVVKFSPTLESQIGASGSYLTFAILALFGTVWIGISVPETKGKTEEQIQSQLRKQKTKTTSLNKYKDSDLEASSSIISSTSI